MTTDPEARVVGEESPEEAAGAGTRRNQLTLIAAWKEEGRSEWSP